VTWQWASILPVWVLAVVGAVLVAVLATPEEQLTWLPIVAAGSILVTFALQLSTQEKRGFVVRVMASIGGAMAVLAVMTGILALVNASAITA
jgi:hypothetical protein